MFALTCKHSDVGVLYCGFEAVVQHWIICWAVLYAVVSSI
jgi:hypothetical protein